jgi:hypothetical protein
MPLFHGTELPSILVSICISFAVGKEINLHAESGLMADQEHAIVGMAERTGMDGADAAREHFTYFWVNAAISQLADSMIL